MSDSPDSQNHNASADTDLPHPPAKRMKLLSPDKSLAVAQYSSSLAAPFDSVVPTLNKLTSSNDTVYSGILPHSSTVPQLVSTNSATNELEVAAEHL